MLYAFQCGASLSCSNGLHWTLDLTSRPLTSPVIGPDGLIAVAHEGADASSSFIALVRSDGKLFSDQPIPGQAVGELAVGSAAAKLAYAPNRSLADTLRLNAAGFIPYSHYQFLPVIRK